ncbi:MAG TPA: trypsin-like peptidase domain-containing protein [Acetobacteraceae bacterium]|nr:trypsin-like peptidase domain-containing protein [Acetobacteraceae bacterium]
MRRTALLLLAVTLAALRPAPAMAGGSSPALSWAAIARQVVPAVVNITSLVIHKHGKGAGVGERERFVGSGFIVAPSGLILTNKHVIAGAFRITVTLHDGTEVPAHLVAAASLVDLAVLKIDAGHPLPVLKLAGPDAVQPGDPVLAVGNPLGVGTSLSAGIVSGVNRSLMMSPFDDYVQTDAAINHGNSGGPLIDAKGQVVGVDTILLTNHAGEGSNGLGFAISATVARYVLRHLVDPKAAPIGWIGVSAQDMTPDLARGFGLHAPLGFLVTGVDPNSPAARAGVHSGDVILRYGYAKPDSARALMRVIGLMPLGSPVPVTLWDAGKTRTVSIRTVEWPHLMEARGTMVPAPGARPPLPSPGLGLLLARISGAARKEYGIGPERGLLVVAVDKDSEAYVRGITVGTVIEKIAGTRVTEPFAAYRLIEALGRTHRFIPVLARWSDGARWIALRPGYQEPAEHGAPGVPLARRDGAGTPARASARAQMGAGAR